MSKSDIDYSNTIIYKITCKDSEIKDVYVGHTTNFVQRKRAHKQCCNNDSKNDCKLYKTIKENGGWSNWKMEIINFFNCCGHYEARQREQEYFVSLNANLNSIEPMPKPKDKPIPVIKPIKQSHICEVCNINSYTLKQFEVHLGTKMHKKRVVNPNIITSTNIQSLYCEKCDFKCCKKGDWNRHLLTSKHVKACTMLTQNISAKDYACECGNRYTHRQSLYTHTKICNFNTTKQNETESDSTLIVQLIKQNQELKVLIVEQNTKMTDTFTEAIKTMLFK